MDTTLIEALRTLAARTIRDCAFTKRATYFGKEEDTVVLLPSGDEKYLSFWVRDCAMMAESGLIPDRDLERYLSIIALCGQNGADTRLLENGLTVPPYAVADHINYDGRAVFFPGTYRSGSDQGNGGYGFFPPFCDNYFFILMAAQYVAQSSDTAILGKDFGGMTLMDRLERAAHGYNIDRESGLCESAEDFYTVDWGFVDTVKKSGKLLMASLLRYNAHTALSGLCNTVGEVEKGKQYLAEARKISDSVRKIFYDDASGWLYSATGIGHQYDVWGTAYAVFSGVTRGEKTLAALARAYRDGTAVVDGYVRHIPADCNHSSVSAWESSTTALDRYQNGAYWATATGWYAYALWCYDHTTDILTDFLAHTTRFSAHGAPFEWIDRKTEDLSGLHYGTSGALPYIGAMRIAAEGGSI